MDREHVKGAADKAKGTIKVPVSSLVIRKWKTKESSIR